MDLRIGSVISRARFKNTDSLDDEFTLMRPSEDSRHPPQGLIDLLARDYEFLFYTASGSKIAASSKLRHYEYHALTRDRIETYYFSLFVYYFSFKIKYFLDRNTNSAQNVKFIRSAISSRKYLFSMEII